MRACGAVGFVGAGAMVSMLLHQPPDPRDAQLPLRFISAAPIAAGIYRDIEKRYGCRIVTMYGLTEAFPIAVKGVADEGVPGTSGRPNPSFDVRIVDPTASRSRTDRWGRSLAAPLPARDERGLRERSGGWCRPAPAVVPHRGPRRAGQRGEPDLRRPGEGFVAPSWREHLVGRSRDRGDGAIRRCSRLPWSVCPATWVRTTSCCSSRCDRTPRWITQSCWTSAAPGCRTSGCRDTSRSSTSCRRPLSGGSAKIFFAARGVGPGAWDRESHGYIVSR